MADGCSLFEGTETGTLLDAKTKTETLSDVEGSAKVSDVFERISELDGAQFDVEREVWIVFDDGTGDETIPCAVDGDVTHKFSSKNRLRLVTRVGLRLMFILPSYYVLRYFYLDFVQK